MGRPPVPPVLEGEPGRLVEIARVGRIAEEIHEPPAVIDRGEPTPLGHRAQQDQRGVAVVGQLTRLALGMIVAGPRPLEASDTLGVEAVAVQEVVVPRCGDES